MTEPALGPAGIQANVEHLEARVQASYRKWQEELAELEYWADRLAKISEHQHL
jgi:hypothetical protein